MVGVLSSAGYANAESIGCGAVLTANVTLESDLSGCLGDGLVVAGSGVTIDLDGHTISGVGMGAGVRVLGDFVTVANGSIKNFEIGAMSEFSFPRVQATRFTRLNITRNGLAGVMLTGFRGVVDSSTIAFNAAMGVYSAVQSIG